MTPTRALALVAGVTACAGLSGAGMLKSPAQEQCASAGLKGCPEMVDGVVLYMEGKKPEAEAKLAAGAAANSPEDVRRFAELLKTMTSLPIPGVGQYTVQINEVATLLAGGGLSVSVQAPAPVAATPAPKAETTAAVEKPAEKPPAVPADPSSDPLRMTTQSTAAWTDAHPCKMFGKDAMCRRVRLGPFVLTDVSALPGCPDAMYLGGGHVEPTATVPGGLYQSEGNLAMQWAVPATHPGIHGARYVVRTAEPLLVAVVLNEGRPSSESKSKANPYAPPSSTCVVTWSGYRPDRVDQ